MTKYILASDRPWSLNAFLQARTRLPGQWSICISAEDLDSIAKSAKPRFVFFPHWSSIVPSEFLRKHECVCFHMTDVPFGRGGSPLQNLIERGYSETMLTALRMEQELDSGPVYLKRPLQLSGSAAEIFQRASDLTMQMIEEIIASEPIPTEQVGKPINFRRRTPDQSLVPKGGNLSTLYDHIRMLDAPGYPLAFLEHGNWTGRLAGARLMPDAVEARIRFTPKSKIEKK